MNTAKDDGATPFYVACQQGHVAVARMLAELSGGNRIANQRVKNGYTALHVAAYEGKLDGESKVDGEGADFRPRTPPTATLHHRTRLTTWPLIPPPHHPAT